MTTKGPDAILGESRATAKKAFQRLWVAGAMGAFFSALIKTLPVDWANRTSHPNWAFTFETWLRYSYLLWLLAYFFASNLRAQSSDPPRKWEVTYDLIQSISALIAAYFMGFVVTVDFSDATRFGVANAAIFAICFLAFCWSFQRVQQGLAPNTEEHKKVQRLRIAGAIVAAISALLAIFGPYLVDQVYVSSILLITLLILATILWIFIKIRIKTLPPLQSTVHEATTGSASIPTEHREAVPLENSKTNN